MPLKKYHKKRDFSSTQEPYGRVTKKNKKLLYLIQKHAASHLHYDLRLEMDGVLKSWAIPKGPSLDPSVKRLAVHVEDHPIQYGSFEGIIPAGQYGGGTVMLWDTGEWQGEDTSANAAYKKGSLTFFLKGKKLKGLWKLIRLKNDPKNWLLIKVNDKYAQPEESYSIVEEKPNSVKSRRTLEQISGHTTRKTSKLPSSIHPELATLVDKPPLGNEWLHEIKFDGYRIISFVKDKKVKLMTRNNNDWTKKFPSLAKQIVKLNLKTAILDGEVVALNSKQHSDFQILQNSIHDKDTSSLIYYVFDLIYYNGKNLTTVPLLERKKILHKLVPKTIGMIRYSDHVIGKGAALFKKSCQFALEGIISKNINSHYEQKRSHSWLKIKCTKRQEFIVAGFTKPKGQRGYFGSILLAVYSKNKQLKYCGNVGTGFTEDSLKSMKKLLDANKTSAMPFSDRPKVGNIGQVTWVKPNIVVEVEFTEWTNDGSLRHPSFKQVSQERPKKVVKKRKKSV